MPATKPEIDAAKAQETEADHDPDSSYVTVPLAGYDGVTKDVRVLPPPRWRASAMRALNSGDFDGCMERVLHEDDYAIYEDLDPDGEAIGHMAQLAAEEAGESMGKSSGPSRSGRSTRRR